MITKPRQLLSMFVAAAVVAVSGPVTDAHAEAARAVAAAPTARALLALERQASEAYARGDGKFFEALLSDKIVMREGGARLDKAEVVGMISGNHCDLKKGWTLSAPLLLRISQDAYVLSYVSDAQGRCTAHGKTEEMPSPVRVATVWVRHGRQWQAAFHGENLIFKPAAASATGGKAASGNNRKAATNAPAAVVPAHDDTAADPLTRTLMAAEHSLWDAWKDKDARRLEGLTAPNIAFVDYFGSRFDNKADTIKDWTGPLCDITKVALADGNATSITPTVAILTLAGTVNGSCGGQSIDGTRIDGNSVYVKDRGAWKWVFGFNSPR